MTAGDPVDRAPRGPTRIRRIAGWVAAIVASLLVFAAYRQPEMMMQMAQQLWSCF